MERLTLVGRRDARVTRAALPPPAPGHVLVRVKWSAICGTDRAIWRTSSTPRESWGHEVFGHVVEAYAPATIEPGAAMVVRTTCPCGACASCRSGAAADCDRWSRHEFNGFSSYVCLPDVLAVPVPDAPGVPYVLVEPAYVALDLLCRSRVSAGDDAVLVGCGPIALMLVLALREHGAARIHVVCRSSRAARRDLALQFGARVVDEEQFDDVAPELGCAAAVVTAPYGAIPSAAAAVRYGGTVVYNGLSGRPQVDVDFGALHRRRISLVPSFPHPQTEFDRARRFVERNAPELARIITPVPSLDDAQSVFEELDAGGRLLKPAFRFD